MESKVAQAIRMKYSPVAVVFTDEEPQGAFQFEKGKWGCVAAMLNAAAKGKTVVFTRETHGCQGGGTGLGFGNTYKSFPGGIEYFLANGNPEFCNSEEGKQMLKVMPHLEHGESYKKTPELAKKFIESLPMTDVPAKYVVYKPLEKLSNGEIPKVVVFLVNPDQLSALVVLANYARENNDNVILSFGAGCHQTGIMAYKEAQNENPKAIIGLTDVSVRAKFERDILSFSVPYKMFLELESNLEGSFLEKKDWLTVAERYK